MVVKINFYFEVSMFGWLMKKAEAFKYYMCAKETFWFLQSLSDKERSTFILLTAFSYQQYMKVFEIFNQSINLPYAHFFNQIIPSL